MAKKKSNASHDPMEAYADIIDLLKQGDGPRTTRELKDEFCTGPRKHFHALLPLMLQALTVAELAEEVEPAAGPKPGVYKPGPRARRAKSELAALQRAGALRIPWGLTKTERVSYIEDIARAAAGRAPKRTTGTMEEEALERLYETPSVQRGDADAVDGVADFLLSDGGLPPGHVLMKRNGTFALGRPEDLRRLQGNG